MLSKQTSLILGFLLVPYYYLQMYWPFLRGEFVNGLDQAPLSSICLVFNSVINLFL